MKKRKKKPPFAAKRKQQEKSSAAWAELRKLPSEALITAIDTMIGILQERGVTIRDWDDKSKAVRRLKRICGKPFILSTREKPEASTDGENGELDKG